MSKFALASTLRANRRATLPANVARAQQAHTIATMHRIANAPIPGTAAYAVDRFGSGKTGRLA